jgi:SLT domain-containing protein
MHYGEGNWGGLDQVIVLTDNATKKRTLSAILQNVVDMWRAAMGLAQEPMGPTSDPILAGCSARAEGSRRPSQPFARHLARVMLRRRCRGARGLNGQVLP